MKGSPICPGCHGELDVVAATGRVDDRYVCSRCHHWWYAFEIEQPSDEGGSRSAQDHPVTL